MTNNPLLSDAVVEAMLNAMWPGDEGVYDDTFEDPKEQLWAGLKALTDAGFVVVPVEPTLGMSIMGMSAYFKEYTSNDERVDAIYKAMLEAAKGGA